LPLRRREVQEPVMTDTGDSSIEQLESLYREMLPQVHRFACSRLGSEDGRDVASEVFHAAVVAFGDGRAGNVTPAWLMAVTRNKVIDRWRQAERRSAISLRVLPRKSDQTEFPDDWYDEPHREAVLRALGRLAKKDRGILVLHYVDGIPAPELAASLDVSVSAIESRLARARRKFKSFYQLETPLDKSSLSAGGNG
jgi:RNA polymerase sigma-70 factor (ECF subfamily)